MDRLASGVLRWRKPVYIVFGILAFFVMCLEGVQAYWLLFGPDPQGFAAVQSLPGGLPPADQHSAFLILNPDHSSQYPGNLLQLLATSEAGVVDTAHAAHLKSSEVQSVLIQSESISTETSDYHVSLINDATPNPMSYTRQPGGLQLFIQPKDGNWKPGVYLVDVPAEGMFGGRDYYQFYIDP